MPTNPYAEKTVLVTGGTGSFGNFVVRRLLELMADEFSDTHLRAFRRVVLDEVKPAEAVDERGVSVNVVLLAR